uniref:HMG box domain-containing protein n=1 Tax=Gasterosteus aculeatus aculeatus TaxID=481459 RepID=A0AAQ4PNH9_GASAC
MDATSGLVLNTKPQPGYAAPAHPAKFQQQRSIVSNEDMCDGAVCAGDIGQRQPELALPVEATLPPMASTPKKTKSDCKQEGDRPYTKKPLNAFFVFSRENRASLLLNVKGSGSKNKTLGRMWLLLTSEEKAKHVDMAKKERQQHALKHPNWSCRNNYGKNKHKRSRRRSRVEAAKKQCLSPASVQGSSYSQTSVQGPSYSQTSVQRPSYSQTSVQGPSHSQTYVQGPAYSQTSVQEPVYSQTSVQRPSYSQTSVQGPSHSQTYVQGPAYSQTSVQEPVYSQTSVQRPSYSQTSVQGP